MTDSVPVRRIAILAPMPTELRPVVRHLSLRRPPGGDTAIHSGAVGEIEVVATTTGMGTHAATRAIERVLSSVTVDHVVVVGIAGGMHASLEIGEIVVPETVVHGETGAEYRPAPLGDVAPSGKLWTSDELIVDKQELARLRAQGVVALDMETAAIAAVCERRERQWSVFRAISDRVTDDLVDNSVFGLAHPDGSPNLRAVARFVLRQPWQIGRLVRLARDANTATTAAARAAARALRHA